MGNGPQIQEHKMMTYSRTSTINGQYAYRASNGNWYVIDRRNGKWTGEEYATRQHAIAAMNLA